MPPEGRGGDPGSDVTAGPLAAQQKNPAPETPKLTESIDVRVSRLRETDALLILSVGGGDLEKREVVCNDVLTRYKHEVNGTLDFKGTGLRPADCHVNDDGEDKDSAMNANDEH